MFELADPIPNMDSMGHFQVSSTYSQRVLKLMKFWSESFETFAQYIGVRDSRRHIWAIFKLAVRILESFETNEILVKLRTGQDLETGRV